MLEPPPELPRPGLSPPEGDMASEPLALVLGTPTLEPGWDESTTPEPPPVPPSALGGARTDPASPGPPRPEPFLPAAERPAPTEGGGGTTLLARSVALPGPPEFPVRVESWLVLEPATEGGGGITFDAARAEPGFLPEAAEPPNEGGGGTTLAAG